MQFVPWQNIADWHCKGCGYCCKLYSVVLGFTEWMQLAQTFGAETTVAGLDRFYIKRTSDGSCAFLCNHTNRYYCNLQARASPKHAKSGPSKCSPNQNTARKNKQPTTMAASDSTFTGIRCAAACAVERQHGISATPP